MQIGIIGLPNVGKSTLFNALLKKQVALSANYPFATIDPNVGIVNVPDKRIDELVKVAKNDFEGTPEAGGKQVPQKVVPATVRFVDIAGLVKRASEGEGLGNKFLSHIREVDAIVHVIRVFEDENVARAGSKDPKTDKEVIETELILADLTTLQKRIESVESNARTGEKEARRKLAAYQKINVGLEKETLASDLNLTKEERGLVKDLNLLTLKPVIYVFNHSEEALKESNFKGLGKDSIHLCAKMEAEISALSKQGQSEYLNELGIKSTGLDKVIKKGYEILGLISFFSLGPKEVHAWTIKKGTKAPQAAGTVHTDFERGFISAEVISYGDLASVGSWKVAKTKGLVRVEGKDYVFSEGDIANFRFSV